MFAVPLAVLDEAEDEEVVPVTIFLTRVDCIVLCRVSSVPAEVNAATPIEVASSSLSAVISKSFNSLVPVLNLNPLPFGIKNSPSTTPSAFVKSEVAPSGCPLFLSYLFPASLLVTATRVNVSDLTQLSTATPSKNGNTLVFGFMP